MRAHEPQRRVLRVPLTPLIDVVFILLLFFMLSSTFQRQGVVDVQRAVTGSAGSGTPRLVLVHSQHTVQVDGRRYDTGGRAWQALARRWAHDGQPVTVTPLATATVQSLVRVVDALRNAGVVDLDITRSRRP